MGVGTWAGYLVVVMKQVEFLAGRISRLETLEPAIGRTHDHDGGDGALVPEAGLHADVIAQLVTNGDTHDHIGGDGDPIDTDALANLAVTAAKMATAVQNKLVTNGDNHDHISGDGDPIDTNALVNKAVTGAKIDDLAVDTGQIAGKAVTQAKIDDLAVDTGQLASKAVTGAKIDDNTVDTGQLTDSAVNSDKIANNAVSDHHIGSRVPMFTRRKGGSSSNWQTPGSSSYTPSTVKMQGGSFNLPNGGGSVSFPQSFGGAPIVVLSVASMYGGVYITSVSSSSFSMANSLGYTIGVMWLAIGSE